MSIETRDVLTLVVILVSIASTIVVSRNARKATAINAQNVDLARIRDLRAELAEAKTELGQVKLQVAELSRHLTDANDRAISYARREIEMLQYARIPGMDMATWLRRFDPDNTHEITGQRGR